MRILLILTAVMFLVSACAAGDPSSLTSTSRQEKSTTPASRITALGQAALQHGDFVSAEQIFSRALAQDPQDDEAMRGLSHALLRQNRAAEAVILLQKWVETSPSAASYNSLAVAADYSGQEEIAQHAYTQGLMLEPRHVGLLNNAALSLALRGRTSEALTKAEQLQKVTKMEWQDARVRKNLAIIYALAGHDTRAQTFLDPGTPQAHQEFLNYMAKVRALPNAAARLTSLRLKGLLD